MRMGLKKWKKWETEKPEQKPEQRLEEESEEESVLEEPGQQIEQGACVLKSESESDFLRAGADAGA